MCAPHQQSCRQTNEHSDMLYGSFAVAWPKAHSESIDDVIAMNRILARLTPMQKQKTLCLKHCVQNIVQKNFLIDRSFLLIIIPVHQRSVDLVETVILRCKDGAEAEVLFVELVIVKVRIYHVLEVLHINKISYYNIYWHGSEQETCLQL